MTPWACRRLVCVLCAVARAVALIGLAGPARAIGRAVAGW